MDQKGYYEVHRKIKSICEIDHAGTKCENKKLMCSGNEEIEFNMDAEQIETAKISENSYSENEMDNLNGENEVDCYRGVILSADIVECS